MAFSPAPGVAQLVLAGKWNDSEEIVHVIHVQRKNDGLGSPWPQADLRNAALRLSLAWQRWQPVMSSIVKYQEVRSRDLASATGAVDLLAVALQGTEAGNVMPPNVCYLVQWRTGRAGRGANGRTYISGLNENSVDGMGRLVPAAIPVYSGHAQGVITDLGAPTSALLPGAPLDMVVVHKPTGVPLSRGSSPVIVGRVSSLIGSQRRRLPKRV
jgi:hypothetical protein